MGRRVVKFAPILRSCDLETDMDPACWFIYSSHGIQFVWDCDRWSMCTYCSRGVQFEGDCDGVHSRCVCVH